MLKKWAQQYREHCIHELEAARERDYLLIFELYCDNSDCPTRQVSVRVKDYDRELVTLIRQRPQSLQCVVCGETLKCHWVRTQLQHGNIVARHSRSSVATQM